GAVGRGLYRESDQQPSRTAFLPDQVPARGLLQRLPDPDPGAAGDVRQSAPRGRGRSQAHGRRPHDAARLPDQIGSTRAPARPSAARLALCARRLERVQAVARHCRELGSPKVTSKRVDISKSAEARGFVAGALRDFEGVDVLVNNAGAGWSGHLKDMPEDTIRQLVDTNLLGVIWTTQAALPAMIAAHRGVIINVASVAGYRPTPYSAVYGAT